MHNHCHEDDQDDQDDGDHLREAVGRESSTANISQPALDYHKSWKEGFLKVCFKGLYQPFA